jgi:hypothetical protein
MNGDPGPICEGASRDEYVPATCVRMSLRHYVNILWNVGISAFQPHVGIKRAMQ